jgi:hypothetical protein
MGGYDAAPGVDAGIWRQLATEGSSDDVLTFYRIVA